MQNQDRVAHLARSIFLRCSQGVIVQLDLSQLFPRLEREVFDYKIARLGRGIVGGAGRKAHQGKTQDKHCKANSHGRFSWMLTEKLNDRRQGCKEERKSDLNPER